MKDLIHKQSECKAEMSTVVCKLPNAGLGNQLFPLMHALIFGKLNNLPVIIIGYNRFRLGPWLRREKKKRNYNGYFTFEKSWFGEVADRQKIKRLRKKSEQVIEPDLVKMPEGQLQNKIFVFQETGDFHDYFGKLKNYREQVIETLYSVIQPWVINQLEEKQTPVIGVHIRLGDFRKLAAGETYRSGHVRPPLSLFIDLINRIRTINGNDLPVGVFSDGYRGELAEILLLKNTVLSEHNSDLADLLLLSKSAVIIPTHGSTFSAWACFLSSAPIISLFNYPKSLRPDNLADTIYEGTFDGGNKLLIKSIVRI